MSKVWEYFKEMRILMKCRACNKIKCHCDEIQELEWQASQVEGGDPKWK